MKIDHIGAPLVQKQLCLLHLTEEICWWRLMSWYFLMNTTQCDTALAPVAVHVLSQGKMSALKREGPHVRSRTGLAPTPPYNRCFPLHLSDPSTQQASVLWGICSGMMWCNRAMQSGDQKNRAQLKGYFEGMMKQQGCVFLTSPVLIRNRIL